MNSVSMQFVTESDRFPDRLGRGALEGETS
jgi:hypothetical protein